MRIANYSYVKSIFVLMSIAYGGFISAEEVTPSSEPVAQVEVSQSIQVFNNINDLRSSARQNKTIYFYEGEQYSGSSLLPFGSRASALAEAKEKADGSRFKDFLITRDGEKTMTTFLISGIHHVITIRAISFVEASPENVSKIVIENRVTADLAPQLVAFIEGAEYEKYVSQFKDVIKSGADKGDGFLLPALVSVVAKSEGKDAVEDLKKWSKYHKGLGVRGNSYQALLDLGEVDYVEEIIKGEKNADTRNKVEDKIRKIRISS